MVWVARRRQWGMLIPDCLSRAAGVLPEPCELVVMDVTDQGQRRPVKVARLLRLGEHTPVGELVAPRVVHLRRSHFVLSGTERQRDTSGKLMGFAQSWLCQLAPPFDTAALEVSDMYRGGVAVDRAAGDVYPRKGELAMGFERDGELGRITPLTRMLREDGSVDARQLLDTALEWVSGGRFMLSGYERTAGSAGKPPALLVQAWLGAFQLPRETGPGTPGRHGRPRRE
jgi:hypothetical protein